MKRLFSAALLAAMFLSASAQHYKISGKAPAGTSYVILHNIETKVNDTLSVAADGTFRCEGDEAGHSFAYLTTEKGMLLVFCEGDIVADFTTGRVSGNAENEGLSAYWAKSGELRAPLEAMQNELNAKQQRGDSIPEEDIVKFKKAYSDFSKSVTELAREELDSHKNMRYPALILFQNATSLPKKYVISLTDENPAYMSTSIASRIKKQVEGWKRQAVGARFSEVEMADTLGKMHKLSEYIGSGKYVLVDFWASWCGPCMAELPNLKAAYDKYHAKGFEVVGLSFDQSRDAWVKAIRTKNMNWHHLSDLKGWGCVAGQVYGINSIPQTLLIGPDGTIVAGTLRGNDLQKKLAEIFGE